MQRPFLLLFFAGAVLCSQVVIEDPNFNSYIEELEQPQSDNKTKKEEFEQEVWTVLRRLPKALSKHSEIMDNDKLTHKQKRDALKELMKGTPKVFQALKAIFRIVRSRRGPRFVIPFRPHRLNVEGRMPKKPFGRPEKKGFKGEYKEEKKPEKLVMSEKVVPVKA